MVFILKQHYFFWPLKTVLIQNYYDYCTGYKSKFDENFEIETNKNENLVKLEIIDELKINSIEILK